MRTYESGVRRHSASKYWITAIVGLAVLLSGCFGGQSADAFLATVAPTPEPMYEPAGEVGNNPFFSVDEQVAATNSGVIRLAVADAEAAGLDPLSAIAQVTLTSPSEDEIKSGLYGGSLENTCDPERLIKHLLDNPTQGQVWADVQGIEFSEIPTFIRSLEVEILDADRLVLNHGYDPKGHAIPIVSTLSVGTAVLVDDNGDVRTRCYCGNPILPYDEQDYEPPQCLTFFAVVFTTPSDRKELENVPRSVKATNQIGSYEGVEWKQITWGDSTGWVRADESETRYCKPHDKIECVDAAQITQRPGSDAFVGELQNSYVSVVAANLDGWSLIKFAETSGWIEAAAVGGTNCDYDVECVVSTSGTWTRPGFAGNEFVRPGQTQRIEYTGQTFFDATGTYRQAYVTNPSPARIGYLKQTDVTTQDANRCEPTTYCTLFDVDVNVYQESEGTATWGVMWFGEVKVLGDQPTNGRYQLDWGTATGWVDIGDLHGFVTGHPCVTQSCIQVYGQSIYEPLPAGAGTRATPSGAIVATFTGKVHYDGGDTYREFTSPAVAGGPGWIEASVGYYPRDWSACEVEPPCNAEYDVCEIKCIADYNSEGWTVRAVWSPSSRLLNVNFAWPPGLTGMPMIGLKASGVSDFASGSPTLAGPITVTWSDPVTGQSGQTECQVDLCDFLDFDGDLGYLDDVELPDPETCVRVECTSERVVGSDGLVRESVTLDWAPATTQLEEIDFDFPTGYSDGTRFDRLPPQTFTQFTGPPGVVNITWIGPDGQSGTVSCEVGGGCDVFDIVFPTAESADCCPDGTEFVNSSSECCPSERLTRFMCCAEGSLASENGECITCDGVKIPNFGCCPADQVLNSEFCCPDGTSVVTFEAGSECLPDCPDGTPPVVVDGRFSCEGDADPVPTATPQPTATPEPLPTATPGPQATTVPRPTAVPQPTATAVPQPTPTPTPVSCPNGANENGDCFRICAVGELNLDGLCTCSDGLRLDGVNGCIIDCPGNQIAVGDGCACPAGTTLQGSGCVTVVVEPPACASPYNQDGTTCFYQGFRAEPTCPPTGGIDPMLLDSSDGGPAETPFSVTCAYTTN